MTTGAERLEKIATFLDKELRAFRCRVIVNRSILHIASCNRLWIVTICRYCEIINHVSYLYTVPH